jgi:hypothetical protein
VLSTGGRHRARAEIDMNNVSGQEGEQAVLNELKERLDLYAEDAKKRGFVYFRADLHANDVSVRLQFADGKGRFYERSVGLRLLVKKHFGNAFVPVYSDIANLVNFYIRDLPGMGILDHSMLAQRVPAKVVGTERVHF